MGERLELLMRVFVAIVTGIILEVWGYFVAVITIFNWIFTLFAGKRNKDLADLAEIWNTQRYIFTRYLLLVTNDRPFPFNKLTKNLSKFSKKR